MKFLVLALCVVAAAAEPHWMMMETAEVNNIKHTWDTVKMKEIDILYNVFKAYPDIQARFPKFVNKDLETLKGTADFALHAGRIVGLFTEYITLLGKTETQPAIKTILNQMGQNHKNRGIPKELFNKFRTAVMTYLSTHGDGYNAQYWDDCFDKMYYVVFSAMDGRPVQ